LSMIDNEPIDNELIIAKCEEFARKMAPKDLHHGIEHVLRVRNYAMRLAKSMSIDGVDLMILEVSALLHDVGRGHELPGEYHTHVGSGLARTFLRGLGVPEGKIDAIAHCIETHSRKKAHRKKPESIEAKILYDADGLDMIGAVGILRIALSAAVKNKGWDHIKEKAKWRLTIVDDFMTPQAVKIANQRSRLVTAFVDQLYKELGD